MFVEIEPLTPALGLARWLLSIVERDVLARGAAGAPLKPDAVSGAILAGILAVHVPKSPVSTFCRERVITCCCWLFWNSMWYRAVTVVRTVNDVKIDSEGSDLHVAPSMEMLA